jgi:hypothetical protein
LLSGQIKLLPAFQELARDSIALLGKPSNRGKSTPDNLSFIQLMLEGLQCFSHEVLIVLSEADLTAREFSTLIAQDSQWKSAIAKAAVTVETLPGADHTFSQKPWNDEVTRLTIDWMKSRATA